MHALRIGLQGIELLETGRITLPVPEPHRAMLRRIRAGEPALDEITAELDSVTARVEAVVASGELPADGDQRVIDEYLVRTYRDAWR